MTTTELQTIIDQINAEQDFDLAWRWAGQNIEPLIEIYEEADRHTLTFGTLDDIEERLRKTLPAWDLEYPSNV